MGGLIRVLLGSGRVMPTVAVVAGVATGVTTIAMIAVINAAVDDGSPWLAAVFAIAALGVLVSGAVASNALVRVTQRSVDRLRGDVVADLIGMPMRAFEKVGTGRAMAVLTDDLNAVMAAVQAVPLLLVNVVVVTCAIVYIGVLSPAALGIFLIALVVGVGAYRWATGRAGRHLYTARLAQDDLHEAFDAAVDGAKDLRLDGELRAELVDRVRRTSAHHASAVIKGTTVTLVAGYWGQMLFLAAVGAIVFAGPSLGVAGGDLYALALAVLYVNTPLVTVLNIVPVLVRATVALERVRSVGDTAGEGDPMTTATTVADPIRPVSAATPRVETGIGLDAARFSYGDDFGVGPVTHVFARGTTTFVVGGNGSGKSTVGKVLAGLYPVQEGALTLDGAPVPLRDLAAYRSRVSACFADSRLFSRLHDPRPDADTIADGWIRELGLQGVVTVRRDAHRADDLVFDHGGLSTGQAKRLSLVRVLTNPRDVVILDEWAAEQDPGLRDHFYTALLPHLRDSGRVVVVVTHDDRYFDRCDAVLKLERGLVPRDAAPAVTPVDAVPIP